MNPLEMIKPATTGGFSFFELFMTAHPVVKIVMFGLLLASIWAWAIIIEKLFAFRRARREADHFEQQFWSGQSLDELYSGLSRGRTFSMASLFVAAMREWKRSVEGNIRAMGGIQLRVEKVMDVTISREMEQLDRRLLFLATVGSTAPFIGLFGTVWGIMTSFQAIAHVQEHQPRRSCAGHRRGVVCHRPGPAGGHSRRGVLQQVRCRTPRA